MPNQHILTLRSTDDSNVRSVDVIPMLRARAAHGQLMCRGITLWSQLPVEQRPRIADHSAPSERREMMQTRLVSGLGGNGTLDNRR
jgi:hypothetical protein